MIFGALTGAIVWQSITDRLGIPSSSSHALIGGLVGAGMAKAGSAAVVWAGVLKTVAGIVLAPGLGCLTALMLVLFVSWTFVRFTPFGVDRFFRRAQFVSASLYALGHGGNDAQKTMGIIAVLLYSQGYHGDAVPRAVLGGAGVPARDGARHAGRRLAHREDDGIEDHPAHADAGLLRRDRRLDHAVCRDRARHSGVDHAHHHRMHHRRRRGAQVSAVRWSVAPGDRHRLDHHHPGRRVDRGVVLFCGGSLAGLV